MVWKHVRQVGTGALTASTWRVAGEGWRAGAPSGWMETGTGLSAILPSTTEDPCSEGKASKRRWADGSRSSAAKLSGGRMEPSLAQLLKCVCVCVHKCPSTSMRAARGPDNMVWAAEGCTYNSLTSASAGEAKGPLFHIRPGLSGLEPAMLLMLPSPSPAPSTAGNTGSPARAAEEARAGLWLCRQEVTCVGLGPPSQAPPQEEPAHTHKSFAVFIAVAEAAPWRASGRATGGFWARVTPPRRSLGGG